VPGLQCWRAVLDLADHPWLADHRLADTPVLPAAAILDAALWASGRALERVTFDRLVELRGPRELQLVLHPDSRFELLGREPRGAWQPHAAGTLGEPLPLPDRLDLTALRARLAPLDLATLQTTITAVGLEHGPAFASITAVCSSDGEALAELRLPPGLSSAGHSIHPALLDGCLQAIAAATRGAGLPVEIQHIHLARSPGAGLCCHVRTRPEGDFILADLTLTDPDGQPLGQLHALRVRRLAEPAPAHDPHEPAPVLRDRSALESEVTAATREVLGFAADLRIPAAQDLRDLGLDSLLALDLATAIGRRLGRTLVNSFALDYPTIAAMTDALAGASEAP
jgi:acyl carrier protein